MKKQQFKHKAIHRDCEHCRLVNYEFLSLSGQPIMGECIYSKTRFLLNDEIGDCNQYKQI